MASALAEEIASSGEKVVAVHGGGSFGHSEAKKFGLNAVTPSPAGTGVSQTRGAMYELNQLVCRTMMEFKVSPYAFSPADLLAMAPPSAAANWLRGLLKAGLTPVTFGDVSYSTAGFTVVSGDDIVLQLAKILKPDRCVFALDVDGVYEANTRVIIPELSVAAARKIRIPRGDDATGGMKPKLEVAAKVAARGIPVSFVSGYRRNEFSKALKGLDFYGTVVKP